MFAAQVTVVTSRPSSHVPAYRATMIVAKVLFCMCSASFLLDIGVKSEIVERSMDANYNYPCTSLVVSVSQSQGKLVNLSLLAKFENASPISRVCKEEHPQV